MLFLSLRGTPYGSDAARTLGIKCKNSLYSHVDPPKVVLFEHDINHLFSILERVHGWFGQEDFAACGIDLHLLVERVVPKVLHVIPSLDYAVLHLYP